jgi:serine phosphatase RsbU (regulator of sigma subunit)
MSLRTRLVLAFFLLSVVPLAGVTIYSYETNVSALRDAAEREADLLAADLSQRMELVTARLAERVAHLMDIEELEAVGDPVAAQHTALTSTASSATPSVSLDADALGDRIARSLGEAAMLLNNVQLQNMRVGRRGGQAEPDAAPLRAQTVQRTARGDEPPRERAPRLASRRGDRTADMPQVRDGQTPDASDAPAGVPPDDAGQRLRVDMAPVRRAMLRQLLPEGRRLDDLTPEDRRRLVAEVNQRMLGVAQSVAQGIQIGAAELEKQVLVAERDTAASAIARAARVPPRPVAASQPAATIAPLELKRRSTFSGKNIDVQDERDGEVIRTMNAEVDLPNLLATVFSTTDREHGELPFAVAEDGTIYARTEADRTRVAAFGDVATPDGPASVRLADWIIVTTGDRSGSGLRLGIARPVSDSLASLRRTTARNAGLGLLFIGLAVAGIVPLSTRLTRNLRVLGDAVSRIATGDYRVRVPVTSNDDVGRLALAFNHMAADVERHQNTAVEQERIRRELELGRQIQHGMLPHAPLAIGLTHVEGVSVPAREVGGDFFNYFLLADGQIALLMGDVSGKGVGAALLMANIQAALRIRLGLCADLAAVADALDRDIESNSPGPVYATLFIGAFDPGTRRLRYVNAGHNPPYVIRAHGGLDPLPATGLPVGLLAGRGYSERSVELIAGDRLAFYTDGCVELQNEQGEIFGRERLEALLAEAGRSGNALHHIDAALARFRGTSEPLDDAALMTVVVG